MVEEYYLEAISNPRTKLVLRLEETIVLETHKFFQKKGLTSLLLPVTTGSISSPMGLGSDSVPVTIHLNGHKTYLADSMQFLLEYGCRIFPDGCYYVMPTFRGEDIDDRHLKQFFHSEAEIPGKLDDVKTLVEEYLKHLMDVILCKYDYELERGNGVSHIKKFIANSIPTVTFEQAVDFFSGNYAENFSLYVEVSDGYRNITKAGERELIKANGGTVWLSNFDKMAVPFYQKTDGDTALNADLLFGIGETVGCGERNVSGCDVLDAIKDHNVNESEYEWYIKMHERYPLQTSGFGMGVERFLLFILGEKDIRNVQIFRRYNDGKDIV